MNSFIHVSLIVLFLSIAASFVALAILVLQYQINLLSLYTPTPNVGGYMLIYSMLVFAVLGKMLQLLWLVENEIRALRQVGVQKWNAKKKEP